ncbi:hypothetical protein WG66_003090 [Moniliophthora roreri]|nr:hypothetical protein WG66_003090 [Moniliophthora roreri]
MDLPKLLANQSVTEHHPPQFDIPPAILSHILIYAIETNFFDFYSPTGSFSEASYIGQVCRYWRDVSLATPELWSILSLRLDNRGCWHSNVADRLQMHIDHSRNALLSVRIETDAVLDERYLLAPFRKVLGRLSSLMLRTKKKVELDKVVQKYLSVAQHLTLLSAGDRIKVKVNGLKQSSSISLLLYSSFLDSTRLANYSCFLARTHITYLHLKCFPRTALELLKDCPSVIEAHFVLPPHGFPGTEPPTLTRTSPGHSIIPLLLTLTLEVINASLPGYDFPFPALAHFLNSFTAPSLISLFFLSDANQNPHSIYPPPNTEFLSALSNLIYRSSAQITRARIEGIPITTYELVPVLKALYRVRELTLGEAKGKRNKLVTTSLLALLAGRALPYSGKFISPVTSCKLTVPRSACSGLEGPEA